MKALAKTNWVHMIRIMFTKTMLLWICGFYQVQKLWTAFQTYINSEIFIFIKLFQVQQS